MRRKSFPLASFKALDEEKGICEAIVAVFGNVDRGGDRITKGAFTNTLQKWGERGRPIPVVYAHQWDNLEAHVGEVLEAKEVEEGLWVRKQYYLDEPFAALTWKRMRRGTLAEFSFAYDVVRGKTVDNGEGVDPRYVYELQELDLFEVGPCLVGMNPDTQLLGMKELLQGTRREATLQELHDMLIELGAKCVDHAHGDRKGKGEDEPDREGADGAPAGGESSTLAARVALELIEAGYEV